MSNIKSPYAPISDEEREKSVLEKRIKSEAFHSAFAEWDKTSAQAMHWNDYLICLDRLIKISNKFSERKSDLFLYFNFEFDKFVKNFMNSLPKTGPNSSEKFPPYKRLFALLPDDEKELKREGVEIKLFSDIEDKTFGIAFFKFLGTPFYWLAIQYGPHFHLRQSEVKKEYKKY
jgi:hypothetical protein